VQGIGPGVLIGAGYCQCVGRVCIDYRGRRVYSLRTSSSKLSLPVSTGSTVLYSIFVINIITIAALGRDNCWVFNFPQIKQMKYFNVFQLLI